MDLNVSSPLTRRRFLGTHGPDVGKLDYCVEMAKDLGIRRKDFFTPAPVGRKPIEWRKIA